MDRSVSGDWYRKEGRNLNVFSLCLHCRAGPIGLLRQCDDCAVVSSFSRLAALPFVDLSYILSRVLNMPLNFAHLLASHPTLSLPS